MRVVALDLGDRRIGVAVSDRAGVVAVPHGTIERSGDAAADRAAIAAVLAELEGERVVVGLPLSLDGQHGPSARRARDEAAALAEVLPVPVELADERLTTVIAHRSLAGAGVGSRRRRGRVDEVAATVLLQAWLDAKR